jgi:ribosomal protein S18 acetylase RimI-like enzyme
VGQFSIRSATTDDYTRLSRYLNENPLVHRHLDWRPPLDWLGCQPFLLLEDQTALAAVLACPPEPAQAAWVRLFAVEPEYDPLRSWSLLINHACRQLTEAHEIQLAALALEDWFENLLILTNFETHQSIVVLEWNEDLPPARSLPAGCTIRPMTIRDLPVVQRLDELAFAPIWQYSENSLVLALAQTSISTVVEFGGELIAYQMSSQYTSSCHLARLAVNPAYLRQSIGYCLVRQLFIEAQRRGAWRVTVNTQSDNYASLALYHKLGFELSGEEYRVYQYTMPRQTL